MTMIRPRSDVVYGICRGLPSDGVISFFETPLNLTISFVYIFSRGLKQRISSELGGYFNMHAKDNALFMETMISSAHNFGACTNVSCLKLNSLFHDTPCINIHEHMLIFLITKQL